MKSVDDILHQIAGLRANHPTMTGVEIAKTIGRPLVFLEAICKVRKIDIHKPFVVKGPKPRFIPNATKAKGKQIKLDGDTYCDILDEFQRFCSKREFSFRLGASIALMNFMENVSKSGSWQDEIPEAPIPHEASPAST